MNPLQYHEFELWRGLFVRGAATSVKISDLIDSFNICKNRVN